MKRQAKRTVSKITAFPSILTHSWSGIISAEAVEQFHKKSEQEKSRLFAALIDKVIRTYQPCSELSDQQLEQLHRQVDQSWIRWLREWRDHNRRPGRGWRQRMYNSYMDQSIPKVTWAIVDQWPAGEKDPELAYRLGLLLRMITDRIDINSEEVKFVLFDTLEHGNTRFADSFIAIKEWKQRSTPSKILATELDPLKRFLLTRWDSARDGYRELVFLTDRQITEAAWKLLNRISLTPDAVKKTRQRLGLSRCV